MGSPASRDRARAPLTRAHREQGPPHTVVAVEPPALPDLRASSFFFDASWCMCERGARLNVF
jgi:hypothetical protein